MVKWIKRKPVNEISEDDEFVIDKLRKIRGIADMNSWLNPSSKFCHSAYDLDNIDKVCQRIIKAIHTDEEIQIVADIDTDGICSTAIMYNYLKPLTYNISYVHAQRSEGHGVHKVLNKISDTAKLIIIVDSSSNDVEGCKALVEMGKDVIVIDHHKIDKVNEYATIVNCQQGYYSNKHLSGSAMTYKVCQILDEYLDIDEADNFLDLVAIGLVGDMMPVDVMENRYLINNGINKIDNEGIKEILKQSNIAFDSGISTTNISFKIAPILGASSRLDKIEMSLELLTAEDENDITSLCKSLVEMNESRKKTQKEIVERVFTDLNTSGNLMIVVDNDIDSGYRGLIATDIVEKTSKPTFVLSYKDGLYTGSARSVGILPLYTICNNSGLFEFAQGHEGAFGVQFKESNLPKIIEFFNETLCEDDLQHVVVYDLEVDIEEVDDIDLKSIEKFSKIVGQGFPEPKFLVNGLVVDEKFTKKLGSHVRAVMGKNLDTVKINCEGNTALMKFRTNEEYAKDVELHYADEESFATEIVAVGSLNLNKFYNYGTRKTEATKQVFLEDYKILN